MFQDFLVMMAFVMAGVVVLFADTNPFTAVKFMPLAFRPFRTKGE